MRQSFDETADPAFGREHAPLIRAARADAMAKGRLRGDAWDELALLAADLCGNRALAAVPRPLG